MGTLFSPVHFALLHLPQNTFIMALKRRGTSIYVDDDPDERLVQAVVVTADESATAYAANTLKAYGRM